MPGSTAPLSDFADLDDAGEEQASAAGQAPGRKEALGGERPRQPPAPRADPAEAALDDELKQLTKTIDAAELSHDMEALLKALAARCELRRQLGAAEAALADAERCAELAGPSLRAGALLRLAAARLELGGADGRALEELRRCGRLRPGLPGLHQWTRRAQHWVTMHKRPNHYRTLEVPADASVEKVRQAHRRLALRWLRGRQLRPPPARRLALPRAGRRGRWRRRAGEGGGAASRGGRAAGGGREGWLPGPREADLSCRAQQRRQGNDEWLRIGRSYVERTCRAELSSWEACAERFATAGSKLWVVEEGGEVAGCIGAVCLSPERLELVRMYVDGRCRRRGFGRALVQVLLDHALEVGASEVFLTTPQVNEAAICFYQEMGFSLREVIPVEEANLPFNLVQLTRVIELSGL